MDYRERVVHEEGLGSVGKGGRTRRERRDRPAKQRTPARSDRSPDEDASEALHRLIRTNEPDHMSLAGAYAFGYLTLAMAQHEGQDHTWLDDVDPLDLLLLGAVFPAEFRGAGEFGNTLDAWLDVLRRTRHWASIQCFVTEAVTVSHELGLPVDDPVVFLRLATRLEKAGLNERRLPAALLPARALTNARFVLGPPVDLVLPVPSKEARLKAECLFSEFDLGPPYEGTCAEALATGLSLLDAAGAPIRDDSSLLLVALYSALAASDDESFELLAERATSWALGLREDSSLTPIVDILLSPGTLDLDPLTTVCHLFMRPAFTQPVKAEDRIGARGPGTFLVDIALEIGHSHVQTHSHEAIQLGPLAAVEMCHLMREQEEHLGRPFAPDDLIFAGDEPPDLAALGRTRSALLEAFGVHPAWIYASSQNDGLLPRPSGDFMRKRDRDDWDRSIKEYLHQHPNDSEIDHKAEAWKLSSMLGLMSAQTAARDDQSGAQITALLEDPDADNRHELQTIFAFLTCIGPTLESAIEEEPQLVTRAVSLAERWASPIFGQRVLDLAAELPSEDPHDVPAAFVLAVTYIRSRTHKPGNHPEEATP